VQREDPSFENIAMIAEDIEILDLKILSLTNFNVLA